MFVYVAVRDGSVEAVFIDQIQGSEQATITDAEGNVFPLFTYDKQTVFGGAIEGTSTLVYEDRGSYYLVSAQGYTQPNSRVTFARNEATGIDEEATLAPVIGNTTATMLNTDAWVLQSRLLTAGVSDNPYVFNMLADGTTTTEFPITRNLVAGTEGIILDPAQVRGLLEEALLKAKQAEAATTAAAVAALQYSALTPETDKDDLTTSGIADGIWFGAAPANVDGEIFFGYALVVNNQIQTLVIEGTRLVDGEIVLLTTLGDDEFTAIGELVDGKDDFYELITGDIELLLVPAEQAKLVADVARGYGFRGRDSFGLRGASTSETYSTLYSPRFGEVTLQVGEAITRVALDGMVEFRADQYGELFQNLVTGTQTPILYSERASYDPMSTFTTAKAVIALGTTNPITFTSLRFQSENRDILDISSDGKITVRRLEADGTAIVTMDLEFDDQVFTYSTTYTVQTIATYNRNILNALNTVQTVGANGLPDNDGSINFEGQVVLVNIGVELEAPDDPNYVDPRSSLVARYVAQQRFLVKSGLLSEGGTIIPINRVSEGSGSVALTENNETALTGDNFGWFLNYGQSNARAIDNLNDITTPGSYVLTAVARYNTGTNVLLVTRRVPVTIIGLADAITRTSNEIRPGSLLTPGGNITSTSVSLSNRTTVLGISVEWEIAPGTGTGFTKAPSTIQDSNDLNLVSIADTAANTQTLTIDRNYSDQKFFLRGTLVSGYIAPGASVSGGTPLTGANVSRTFEFTVKANTTDALEARAEGLVKGILDKTPQFAPLTDSGAALFLSGLITRPADVATLKDSGLDQIEVRYEFANFPTGYYVQPIYSGVFGSLSTDPLSDSGVSHYMLVKGTVASPALVFSGVITYSDFNGSGLLLLDAVTGEVTVNDSSVFAAATTKVELFKFDLVARVLLSTDTVDTTYNVNTTINHTIVIYKNPTS